MVDYDQRDMFLREVLDAPDDDVPRLIYADWLEEAGDPRGEFIRVQVELEKLTPLEPEFYDYRDRSGALLEEFGEQWATELKQDVRKSEFRRGFIDTITMRARAFIDQAEELFNSVPIHWIRFNYVKGAGAKLAKSGALSRLRSLDLSNLKIPDEDLEAIFKSPNLTGLEALKLTSYELSFGANVGRAISGGPAAETLTSLEVSGSTGSDGFFAGLCSGSGFPQLKHLSVGADYYFDDAFPSLSGLKVPKLRSLKFNGRLKVAECENLTELPMSQLTTLDLAKADLPAAGIKALADSGAFDNLKKLVMPRCTAGAKALGHLLSGDRLAHCEHLDLRALGLSSARVRQELIDALSWHEPLTNLEHLAIGGLEDATIDGLLRNGRMQHLKSFTLEGLGMSMQDVESLGSDPIRESLRCLKLSGLGIPHGPMNRLCEMQFPNLLVLDLSNTYDDMFRLDADGLIQLITSSAFPALRELRMDHCSAHDETLLALAERAQMPELRRISFQYNSSRVETVKQVLQSAQIPRLTEIIVSGSLNSGSGKSLIKEFGGRVRI